MANLTIHQVLFPDKIVQFSEQLYTVPQKKIAMKRLTNQRKKTKEKEKKETKLKIMKDLDSQKVLVLSSAHSPKIEITPNHLNLDETCIIFCRNWHL